MGQMRTLIIWAAITLMTRRLTRELRSSWAKARPRGGVLKTGAALTPHNQQ